MRCKKNICQQAGSGSTGRLVGASPAGERIVGGCVKPIRLLGRLLQKVPIVHAILDLILTSVGASPAGERTADGCIKPIRLLGSLLQKVPIVYAMLDLILTSVGACPASEQHNGRTSAVSNAIILREGHQTFITGSGKMLRRRFAMRSMTGLSVILLEAFSAFHATVSNTVIPRGGRKAVVAGSLAILLVFSVSAQAGGLVPLNNAQMASVSGQSGIMISLQSLNNVYEDPNNPGSFKPYSNCSDSNNTICRLGLQFDGQGDQWLMLKQYYGTLQINKIELTNGKLPSGDTSYVNNERFENADGATCALGGSWPNCKTVAGQTVVKMVYPQTSKAATYKGMTTFLNVGQEAIEQDAGGVKGYALNNNTSSIQSIRISDSLGPNHTAGMRFDGQAYLYGF